MFTEPRYTRSFEEMLAAEKILERCGFLWAFRKIWAEGISCEVGSLHTCEPSVLTQTLTKTDDSIYEIFFCVTHNRIRQAKHVPKLENHYCNDEDEFQCSSRPNPESDGETIAERIIATLSMPMDEIRECSLDGSLTIRQIVISSPGPIDRTEHYYIYERDGRTGLPNLVPLLLDCAPSFVPKRFVRQNHASA